MMVALAEIQQTARNHSAAEASYRRAVDRLESLIQTRPDLSRPRERLIYIYEKCPFEALRNPARAEELNALNKAH